MYEQDEWLRRLVDGKMKMMYEDPRVVEQFNFPKDIRRSLLLYGMSHYINRQFPEPTITSGSLAMIPMFQLKQVFSMSSKLAEE